MSWFRPLEQLAADIDAEQQRLVGQFIGYVPYVGKVLDERLDFGKNSAMDARMFWEDEGVPPAVSVEEEEVGVDGD